MKWFSNVGSVVQNTDKLTDRGSLQCISFGHISFEVFLIFTVWTLRIDSIQKFSEPSLCFSAKYHWLAIEPLLAIAEQTFPGRVEREKIH